MALLRKLYEDHDAWTCSPQTCTLVVTRGSNYTEPCRHPLQQMSTSVLNGCRLPFNATTCCSKHSTKELEQDLVSRPQSFSTADFSPSLRTIHDFGFTLGPQEVSQGSPLWSSGQNSWLKIRIFLEVVVLERGPLSVVRITEELLDRKSSGSGLEQLRLTVVGDLPRWPRDTFYPQKLALLLPTGAGRLVGIFRLRTETSVACQPKQCGSSAKDSALQFGGVRHESRVSPVPRAHSLTISWVRQWSLSLTPFPMHYYP
jgi:hypothetical protein